MKRIFQSIYSNSVTPYFIIIFLLFVFALLLTRQNIQSLKTGYKINELKAEKQKLEHSNRMLSIEKSSLIDYNQIEKKARKDFGFHEPEVAQQLIYDSSTQQLVRWIPREEHHKNKSVH